MENNTPPLIERILGKDYKTTIAGIATALGGIAWAAIDAYSMGAFTGKHGAALIVSLFVVIGGKYMKDPKKKATDKDNGTA